MMDQVKKYSKEIVSNYPDDKVLKKNISKEILDKYLAEESPCFDAIERLMFRLMPYWNTSTVRIVKNIGSVIDGDWQFDYLQDIKPIAVQDKKITSSIARDINDDTLHGKNISIYFVFWLPLTTMLLAHLLHNEPNKQNKFGVAGAGLIMFLTMIIVTYGIFVYANVVGSPYSMFLQHLCPTSYVSVVGFLFTVICAATPTALLVPMTIIYACTSTILHFRIYNQAFKPTLFQMIILFLMLAFFYISNAYMYYANFSWFWTHSNDNTSPVPQVHTLIRHFTDTNF